jgi:hypothetical protein
MSPKTNGKILKTFLTGDSFLTNISFLIGINTKFLLKGLKTFSWENEFS